MGKILGYDWEEIQSYQMRGSIGKPIKMVSGDHGADPIGDGTFRMVPSGEIVDLAERNRRLSKLNPP